jgi:hypothetical protein
MASGLLSARAARRYGNGAAAGSEAAGIGSGTVRDFGERQSSVAFNLGRHIAPYE